MINRARSEGIQGSQLGPVGIGIAILCLRDSMVAESNLFIGSLLREDRSLLKLLDSDDSYLNEELARHYGIPDVPGRQMRKVALRDVKHQHRRPRGPVTPNEAG
jgi:hypothetical protein